MPHVINQPASPGEGPMGTPTPSLPDSTPARPNEDPAGLPTPSVPAQPVIPSIPVRPVRRCPQGYQSGTVLDGQSYGDILVQNNVSYNAMHSTNPGLSVANPIPGTPYCAPPSGSRRLCAPGERSYIIERNETLGSISRSLGIPADILLMSNPNLAPSDFIPGRVICIP